MSTPLVICAHVLLNIVFGWTLLDWCPHRRNSAETLLMSVLFGIYAETLLVATLMFIGIPFVTAMWSIAFAMGGTVFAAYLRKKWYLPKVSVEQPKWYEWLALATIGEKILFAIWQLTRTHTYFDDALRHWSGRARSLFGEVNWSMDPASPFFLAKHIGHNGTEGYPLETVIWRATTAKMNGEWNEVISRIDGILFFIVLLGTIWLAVRRFSNRHSAAAAVFTAACIPQHAWHSASGYSDIAVEAFVVASLSTLLRREWFLAGVMAAGGAWAKNDGLFLYFPSLLIAAMSLQIQEKDDSSKWWKNMTGFCLGFSTIAPWLVFNYAHGLGLSSGQGKLGWHPDAPRLLWNAMFESANSSIFWIGVVLCIAYTVSALYRDSIGRALILVFSVSLTAIAFVFSWTNAFTFLADQSTIHRILMQFSSVAVLTTTCGLGLKNESAAWFKPLERSCYKARNSARRKGRIAPS